MSSGIYQIRNIKNNHIYIGSAVNIKKRWYEHIRRLNKGIHHSKYMQRAWMKYGLGNFEFSIIELCNKQDLLCREQHYIDTINPEYNMRPTAGSQLGFKQSNETKKKLSEINKGKVGYWKGKHLSPEHRAKSMIAAKGKIPWNKGRTGVYSPETLNKMKEIKIGKTHSVETKSKMSDSHKGRVPGMAGKTHSNETRRKMGDLKRGKSLPLRSAEHCRKISESRKLWWQRKKENNTTCDH